jgi:hypothetical protein
MLAATCARVTMRASVRTRLDDRLCESSAGWCPIGLAELPRRRIHGNARGQRRSTQPGKGSPLRPGGWQLWTGLIRWGAQASAIIIVTPPVAKFETSAAAACPSAVAIAVCSSPAPSNDSSAMK